MRDQNQPKECNVSWAFAITNSMAISFNKLFKNQFPQIVLSAQELINCSGQDVSCEYSEDDNIRVDLVLDYLVRKGVTDESCNNYHADTSKSCSAFDRCKDCRHEGCFSTDYY